MSRVHTKSVYEWDGAGYVLVYEEGYEYPSNLPVMMAKGDPEAKAMEQQQMANTQQQMQFSAQLVDIFKQQYGDQKEVLGYLKDKMQPIIDAGGKGYSDEALAAMRTSSTDQLSSQYQNAQRALQAQQFTSGSRDLPSGTNAQINAALYAQEATDKAGTQNSITLQNENLKQQNYWNAINTLGGVGAQFNPQSYAGAATGASGAASSAGNAGANLSQAYTASQQSGLMGMLGSLGGAALGAAGGNPKGFAGLFGCWLAAAVFGEDFYTGTKTNIVRRYLLTDFQRHWYAKPVLWLYARCGKQAAKIPFIVWLFKPTFERIAEEQK